MAMTFKVKLIVQIYPNYKSQGFGYSEWYCNVHPHNQPLVLHDLPNTESNYIVKS